MGDLSKYSIDFSDRKDLSDADIQTLKTIQETLRPIERAELLIEFKLSGKITADEYEILTGIPYDYN